MKVLVIDDDPDVLDALTVGLQLQWPEATVLTAPGGGEGLRAFFAHQPDVVVLDLMLPELSGFDVLKTIRRATDVPVLVLTARGAEADEVRALELGADDYVKKPFGHLALLARIKALLRRAELPPPTQVLPDFAAGDLVVSFRHHEVLLGGEPVKLTATEYRLLVQLVRHAGHLLPHEMLLDRVWGADGTTGASAQHLKVFISRLRAKLERPGGPQYIQTERGAGYRFIRPPAGSATRGSSLAATG